MKTTCSNSTVFREEEKFKITPAYGLLHYADATLKIAFTDQLRDQVIAAADAIRQARSAHTVCVATRIGAVPALRLFTCLW